MKAGPKASSCVDAGFTLIELLVVLALLGFLTLLLFSGLHFGRLAWEGTQHAARSLAEIDTIRVRLREELRDAYPLVVNTDVTHPHVAFDGTRDHLTFLAPRALDVPSGELSWVDVDLGKTESTGSIRVTETPELATANRTERAVPIPDAVPLRFSYYGPGDNNVAQWQDNWSGRMRLPILVRLSAEKSSGAWTDLVVAPRVAADISCRYDPLSGFCRGR